MSFFKKKIKKGQAVHKALIKAGSKEDLEDYMDYHKNDKFKKKK